MNIWSLNKDVRIKLMLLLLTERLGGHCFVIRDVPELNVHAIRLVSSNEWGISAYLYTYGQADNRYGVHLEYPPQPDKALNVIVEMQEDVNFEQLVSLLQVHFDVISEPCQANPMAKVQSN